MNTREGFEQLEVNCTAPEAGHVIAELAAIGSWIDDQQRHGDRILLTADVPKDAVPGFAKWLKEFPPVRGCSIVRVAANDEDV